MIVIVKNGEGIVVGFVLMMLLYIEEMILIDLMCYFKEVLLGIMDFFFINLFEKVKEDGF